MTKFAVHTNGMKKKKYIAVTPFKIPTKEEIKKDPAKYTPEVLEHLNEQYQSQFYESELPVKLNGFVHCGEHEIYEDQYGDGYKMAMFGPDMVKGESFDWLLHADEIFPHTDDTGFAEGTPSSGAHMYCIVPKTIHENGKWKNLLPRIKAMGILEFDPRTDNGKSFCAGTVIDDPIVEYNDPITGEKKTDGYAFSGIPYALDDDWKKDCYWFKTDKEFYDWKATICLQEFPVSRASKRITELETEGVDLSLIDIDNLTDLVCYSPFFTDDGADHTRHGELLSIAITLKQHKIKQDDIITILTDIESVVKTKEGGPSAEKIVNDVFEHDYHLSKKKHKDDMKSGMNVPMYPSEKGKKGKITYWEKFLGILGKIDSTFKKILKKAREAGKKAEEKAIEKAIKARDEDEDSKSIYIYADKVIDVNVRWFHYNVEGERASKGNWRKFNDDLCVWELFSKVTMQSLIFDFCEDYDIDPKKYRSTILEYLQSKREEDPTEYDDRKLMLLNDKKVRDSYTYEIVDFDPKVHKFTKMEKRSLIDPDKFTISIIKNLLNVVKTQPHIKKTCKFPFGDESQFQYKILHQTMVNIFWNYQKDKVCLTLIGQPNTAKTVIANLVSNTFPTFTGPFKITDLHEKGGLNTIYELCYAVQNECNGGYFQPLAVDVFKDILSNIKKYTVRLLYANPISLVINLWMIIAANQLPRLPYTHETESTYKRVLPLYCPNIFERFTTLELLLEEEEFLDKMFTYFISFKPKSIITDLKWFQARSKDYYDWSSNPVEHIVFEHYVRDNSNIDGVPARVIYAFVELSMKTSNAIIPKSLREKVNKAIVRLGGVVKRNMKDPYDSDATKEDRIVGISMKTSTQRMAEETAPKIIMDLTN